MPALYPQALYSPNYADMKAVMQVGTVDAWQDWVFAALQVG